VVSAVQRLTRADWETIWTAVDMSAAGPWDTSSYGPRPDFEIVLNKIAQRLAARKPRP